jgi:hypothetical protein
MGSLTANEAKNASHSQVCSSGGKCRVGQDVGDVGGAGVPVHGHDGQQHQHRAEQRVEEELEAGIDPPRAAPHPDDEEHRDEPAFEEQIEQHQVERAEDADHQRLERQKRDHVLLDARLDPPAGDDADRHQEGGQHHEQDRDAVDAEMVGHDPPTQSRRSSNWKPAIEGSKLAHIISAMTKVMRVVHSATQRMLRTATSSSPRMASTNSAPISGRKVRIERMGQPGISYSPANMK